MSREFGFGGVDLQPGDHLCGFYFGEAERDVLLLPYLTAGLRDGDKCLGVVDSTKPARVLARLSEAIGDVDVAACLASKQLELWPSEGTYLRSGDFEPDAMMAFWEAHVAAATGEGGYGFARVVGEMSWLARVGLDRKRLLYYESSAHRFAPRYPQSLLCLYDMSKLGSGILFDLLKTHPKLLLGGLVLENPHYLTPEELATQR